MGKPPTMSGAGRAGPGRAIAGKSPQAVIDPKWLKKTYFLHQIPLNMEKEGWKQGATFQRLWFSLPAKRRTKANVRTLFVDDQTIKMDWVFGFRRAAEVYLKLVQEAVSDTLWDYNQLAKLIAKAEQAAEQAAMQSLAPSAEIPFPPVADPLNTLTQWKLFDWVASDEAKGAVGGMDPDGLMAALGRFSFYAVPVGTATKNGSQWFTVQIEKIGVFVHDSFDFNDDHSAQTDAADQVTCEKRPEEKVWGAVKAWTCSQPLGVWDLKAGKLLTLSSYSDKSRIWLKMGYTFGQGSVEKKQRSDMARDPKSSPDEDVYIGNATYRNYRQTTGQGGDFVIFSDVEKVPINRMLAIPR